MAQYTYTHLPARTIRVLHLHPGLPEAPLQGTLEYLTLPTATTNQHAEPSPSDYECVSYVWGGDAKPFTLLLTADPGEKGQDTKPLPLPITASLDSFLRRLRKLPLPGKHKKHRKADAVCINQGDSVEKGLQVALMPAIYRAAWRVVVDLGDETHDLNDALQLMGAWWRKHIWSGTWQGSHFVSAREMGTTFGFEVPAECERRRLERLEVPDVEDPRWNAVARFYCRAWFTRVWIVQEFVLAREVQVVCGKRLIPWREVIAPTMSTRSGGALPTWDAFHLTVSGQHVLKLMALQRQTLALKDSAKSSEFTPVEGGKQQVFSLWNSDGPGHRFDFLNLLEKFQCSNATRRRDMYFALMGVAQDLSGDEPELRPDYISPIETVVSRAGRLLWRKGHGVRILLTRGLWQQQPGMQIPSWIPDFTANGDYSKVVNRSDLVAEHYNAAGGTPFHVTMVPGIDHLITVRGVLVDVVDQDPFVQLSVRDLIEQRWDKTLGSGNGPIWWMLRQAAFNMRAVFDDIASTSPLTIGLSDRAVLSALLFGSEQHRGVMTEKKWIIGLRYTSWLAAYRPVPGDKKKIPFDTIYDALRVGS
ncbi:hypothetical protein N0V88_007687 [Collariella sp. IMI 366227]|nr:hypothetical protein N0V88_007687 [Collariella sp. IMI 366227]